MTTTPSAPTGKVMDAFALAQHVEQFIHAQQKSRFVRERFLADRMRGVLALLRTFASNTSGPLPEDIAAELRGFRVDEIQRERKALDDQDAKLAAEMSNVLNGLETPV